MSSDDDDDALFAALSSSVAHADSSLVSSSSNVVDLLLETTRDDDTMIEEVIDEKELDENRKEKLLQTLLIDDRLFTSMKAINSLPRPAHIHVPIVTLAAVRNAMTSNSNDGEVLIPIECAICGETDIPIDAFYRGIGSHTQSLPQTASSNRNSSCLCRISAPLFSLSGKQSMNCGCVTFSERGPRTASLCSYLASTGRLANALPKFQKSATSSERRSAERDMKTRLTNLFKLGGSTGNSSSFGSLLALYFEKESQGKEKETSTTTTTTTMTTSMTTPTHTKSDIYITNEKNSCLKKSDQKIKIDDIAVIIAELLTVVNPLREAIKELEIEGELTLVDKALDILISNSTIRRLIVSIAAEDLIPKVARAELSWQLPLHTVQTAVSVNSTTTSSATPLTLIRLLGQVSTTSSISSTDISSGGDFGVFGPFIPLGHSYEALANELETINSESNGSLIPPALTSSHELSALKASLIAELSNRAREHFEKDLENIRAGTDRLSVGLSLKSSRVKEDYDPPLLSSSSSSQHDDVIVKRIVRVFKFLLSDDEKGHGEIARSWLKALDLVIQKSKDKATIEGQEAIDRYIAALSTSREMSTDTISAVTSTVSSDVSKPPKPPKSSSTSFPKQTTIDTSAWQTAVKDKVPLRSASPQLTDSGNEVNPLGGKNQKVLEHRVSFLTSGPNFASALSSTLQNTESIFPELNSLIQRRNNAREDRFMHILSGIHSSSKFKCKKYHSAVPALVPSILLAKLLVQKDNKTAASAAITSWSAATVWFTSSRVAELLTHSFLTQASTIASCILTKVILNAHAANATFSSSRSGSLASLTPTQSRAASMSSESLPTKMKGMNKGASAPFQEATMSNENKALISSLDPIYVKMVLQASVTSSVKRNHRTSSLNVDAILPLPHIQMQTQPPSPLSVSSSMLKKLFSIVTSNEEEKLLYTSSTSKPMSIEDVSTTITDLITHALVEILLDLTDVRLPHLLDMLNDSDFIEKNNYIQVSQRSLSPWDLALALSDIKLLDILCFSAHHWYGWVMLVPGDERRMRYDEHANFIQLESVWTQKQRREDGLKIARRVCDMHTLLALVFADATGYGCIWLEILFATYSHRRFFHFKDGKLDPWRRLEVFSSTYRDYLPAVILPVVPQTMPNKERNRLIKEGITGSALASLYAHAKAEGLHAKPIEKNQIPFSNDVSLISTDAIELAEMIIHRFEATDVDEGDWDKGDIDNNNDSKNLLREMTLFYIASEGETCAFEAMIEEAEATKYMAKRSAAEQASSTSRKKTILNERAKNKGVTKTLFELPDQLFPLFLVEQLVVYSVSDAYHVKKRTELIDEGWYNCVVPGDIFQRLRDKKAWLEEGGNEYKDGKGPDDADSDDLTVSKSEPALELLLDEGGGYERSSKESISAFVPSTLTSAAQKPLVKLPPVHWPFKHCQRYKEMCASKVRFWDELEKFELCSPKCSIRDDSDSADRVIVPRPLEQGVKNWSVKLALFLFRLYDLQAKEHKENIDIIVDDNIELLDSESEKEAPKKRARN